MWWGRSKWKKERSEKRGAGVLAFSFVCFFHQVSRSGGERLWWGEMSRGEQAKGPLYVNGLECGDVCKSNPTCSPRAAKTPQLFPRLVINYYPTPQLILKALNATS